MSIFGEEIGNSKHVPKHIGIHPKALIRHFKPMINNRKPQNTIKDANQFQKSLIFSIERL